MLVAKFAALAAEPAELVVALAVALAGLVVASQEKPVVPEKSFVVVAAVDSYLV